MGVTVYCKKTKRTLNLTYGGFLHFRMKIAELCNPEWYEHYRTIADAATLSSTGRMLFFHRFDRKTHQLLDQGAVSLKLVDFCLQSDADGVIRYGACKELLKGIGDYSDGKTVYGYAAHADAPRFDDLKRLLQECVDTKSDFCWY